MHRALTTLVLLGCLATPAFVLAAEAPDHLVINEVYIKADTGGAWDSWIEIHNPSSDTLFLSGIWAQYIRSPNFLGGIAEAEGGVTVPPKAYVVLCFFLSNEEEIAALRALWQIPEAVPILPNFDMAFGESSYMVIWGSDQPGVPRDPSQPPVEDYIWVGGHAETPDVPCAGFLPYESGLCAFSRWEDGLDTNDCEADFIARSPTPARSNAAPSGEHPDTWGRIKKQ